MPDLLAAISRGSGTGTSTLLAMQGGRYSKTLATNVPGNEIPFTATACHNDAAFLAGKLHCVATDVYAVCTPDGTLTPTWTSVDTTRSGQGINAPHTGLHYCFTSAGPGLVHAYRNPLNANETRVVRYDAKTDTTTIFDQTTGSNFSTSGFPITSSAVVGNLLFMNSFNGLLQVCDLETGVFTTQVTPLSGGRESVMFMEANGSTYAWSRKSAAPVRGTWWVWLGGTFMVAAQDNSGLNAVAASLNGGCYPGWARNGKLYGCIVVTGEDGWRFFELDLATNVVSDLTATHLPPLLQNGGGFSDVVAGSSWDCGFYVDVDEVGAPRYMLVVYPGLPTSSPGGVLFEHTDAGLVLVGATDLNLGANGKVVSHKNGAAHTYHEGQLWGTMWNAPVPAANGMELSFMFGGDPGNADKVVRLAYASPPGAPDSRAGKLVAPAGGLGQVGASLVDEGGGVYRIDGWDANGVDTLQVIHQTIPEGVPNGQIAEWNATIKES